MKIGNNSIQFMAFVDENLFIMSMNGKNECHVYAQCIDSERENYLSHLINMA